MNHLSKFFSSRNLENTFLIGYYGGTNYGDELLLEILQLLFSKHGVKNVKIYYSNPKIFGTYHHDFSYSIINSSEKVGILKGFFGSKISS
ncbi:MAG: hypothetical protein IPL87_02910 [Candidatus Moraniibacteriota bacterium]|nr:MAG: hypothetical protein IPL87_02910 [Candidatus Moranbacteria bacterium]